MLLQMQFLLCACLYTGKGCSASFRVHLGAFHKNSYPLVNNSCGVYRAVLPGSCMELRSVSRRLQRVVGQKLSWGCEPCSFNTRFICL